MASDAAMITGGAILLNQTKSNGPEGPVPIAWLSCTNGLVSTCSECESFGACGFLAIPRFVTGRREVCELGCAFCCHGLQEHVRILDLPRI